MIETLINQAAQLFDLDRGALLGRSRSRRVVMARQALSLALYRNGKRLGMTVQEVGRLVGGFDHTTVLYSLAAAEQRMKQNQEYAAAVQLLLEIKL